MADRLAGIAAGYLHMVQDQDSKQRSKKGPAHSQPAIEAKTITMRKTIDKQDLHSLESVTELWSVMRSLWSSEENEQRGKGKKGKKNGGSKDAALFHRTALLQRGISPFLDGGQVQQGNTLHCRDFQGPARAALHCTALQKGKTARPGQKVGGRPLTPRPLCCTTLTPTESA